MCDAVVVNGRGYVMEDTRREGDVTKKRNVAYVVRKKKACDGDEGEASDEGVMLCGDADKGC